ncbi:MAG: ABC transporter substrate-binding protein [Roseicyclus sp.]
MSARRVMTGLAASLLALIGPSALAQTICDRPQVEGAPHMVIMLWRGPTEVERGLDDGLAASGHAVNVTCLSAEQDRANLPAMIAEARRLAPDLIYTWGTSVSLATLGPVDGADPERHIINIPAVFTMVSYPVESGLVESFEAPGRDATGSSHTVPLGAQLRAMQSYRPVSAIGVLFNPLEENSVINVQGLTAVAREAGVEIHALPVPLDAAGAPDPSALPRLVRELAARQPQFLFIGPDSFIGEHRDTVIGEAIALGLPSFTGTELEIVNGRATVGLVTSYYNLGRYMAALVEQVLIDGTPPRDIPVRTLSRFTYMVRMPEARELGLHPGLDILDFAEIITEPLPPGDPE